MIGLMFTLCGSILFAILVAIRKKDDHSKATHVIIPVEGVVHPRIKNTLLETYYFRVGLTYVGIGALFQIFPEIDFQIAEISILNRLVILLGFVLLSYLSTLFIKRMAAYSFNKEEPFSSKQLKGTYDKKSD